MMFIYCKHYLKHFTPVFYFTPHNNAIMEVLRLRKIEQLAEGHSANK